MRVGITGTQHGMTLKQRCKLFERLSQIALDNRIIELHHGDCIGTDAQAHQLALYLGFHIVVHPPENPNKRAFCAGHETRPKRPYLDRNKDIVDECELLIALPRTPIEEIRSGTWATLRYARSIRKPWDIIVP